MEKRLNLEAFSVIPNMYQQNPGEDGWYWILMVVGSMRAEHRDE
jgi:hypothetical protein